MKVANPNGSFTLDPNHNFGTVSSYFVENGNYVKLKNLQLGYTFSNSLMEKVKIRSARVFVMGNNLFTITKYSGLDPEIGLQNANATQNGVDNGTYPSSRFYTLGVNVTF